MEVYENGSDVLVSGTLALHRKRDRGVGWWGGGGGFKKISRRFMRMGVMC